jgi:hypothetical protein
MTRRGWSSGDAQDFSPEALAILARAAEEMSYLLDRGYPRDTTVTFIGDRYQLTARQRLLLSRVVSGDGARKQREAKRLDLARMKGRTVAIDGFNTIITLEVALSGSPVVIGQDGTARDLAGLRGTYHLIDVTPRAVALVLDALENAGAAAARFLLDHPVSNSGRLAQLIRELGEGRRMKVAAETLDDVDGALSGEPCIVTSDSVVLDACESWISLGADIVGRLAAGAPGEVWVIDLFGNGTPSGR